MSSVFVLIDPETKQPIKKYDDGPKAGVVCKRYNRAKKSSGSPTRARIVREEAPDVPLVSWVVRLSHIGPLPRRRSDRTYAPLESVHLLPEDGIEWRKREFRKSQEAREPPWVVTSWWRDSSHWLLHYPRPSSANPAFIAYTPSEQWGREDRQLRVRPGRYLTRYFSDIGEATIRAWVAVWEETFGKAEVEFATTLSDMKWVYKHGPNSCIVNQGMFYALQVYSNGGDLSLAYQKNASEDGVRARGIVWKDHKIYGRLYGESDMLQRALEEMGYRNKTLDGARLAKLPHPRHSSGWIMPYVDMHDSTNGDTRASRVDDQGDCFVINERHGEYVCDQYETSMIGYGPDDYSTCERCECNVVDDELMSVDVVNGTESWCNSCTEYYASTCDGCGVTMCQNVVCAGPDGRYRCETCHTDTVTTCSNCDSELMLSDLTEGGLCGDCQSKQEEEEEEEKAEVEAGANT